MTLKEKISLEEVYDQIYKIKFVKVAIPDYLYNKKIAFFQFFTKEALLPEPTIEKIT